MRLLCLVLAALVLTAGCAKSRIQKFSRTSGGVSIAQTNSTAPPNKQGDEATPPAQPTPSADKAWTIAGYGSTSEDARKDALRRAVNEVRDYLKEHNPDLDRPLTPAYLTRGSGIAQVVSEKSVTRDNGEQAWEVDVRLEMKPEHLTDLYDLARKDRMGPRHHIALLVLFGFCSVLAVAGVYLRLENATRGYSTGLLRLAAATVLTVALAVMIVLW